MIWGRSPTSSSYMWMSSWPYIVLFEKTILFSCWVVLAPWSTISWPQNMVYFWSLYYSPLICISILTPITHWSLQLCKIFEIKKCESSNFVLLFPRLFWLVRVLVFPWACRISWSLFLFLHFHIFVSFSVCCCEFPSVIDFLFHPTVIRGHALNPGP